MDQLSVFFDGCVMRFFICCVLKSATRSLADCCMGFTFTTTLSFTEVQSKVTNAMAQLRCVIFVHSKLSADGPVALFVPS